MGVAREDSLAPLTKSPILYDSNNRPIQQKLQRDGVASGVGIVSGYFQPLQLREPDELGSSLRRHETLRTMAQTDAYISETLRIVTLPLLCQATWKVSSALEVELGAKLSPEEEAAADIAALIGCNIFGLETKEYGSDYVQRTSFSQFIRECLTCLTHGFSIFHKTAKSVDGKLVYDRLHWLEPSSIDRWDIDKNDDLKGVWRNYISPDMRPVTGEYIPVDELFLIVWEAVGARYEGCPFVRSQFGPWKRKEFIQRCKMIAVQQASVGQPWAKYDPSLFGNLGDTAANEQRIEDFLQSSLGSGLGTAYLVVPNPSFEAGYMRLDAAALEAFDKLTMHENLGEAHGGSTKSMMLGEIAGGSRATAATQRSTESVVAMALAQIIGEQLQKGVNNVKGLIEELTDWHQVKTAQRRLATVEVDGVDAEDAARNGKTISAYATAGLVKYRPALERELLEGAEIFLPEDEFDVKLHPELLAPPVTSTNAATPPGKDGLPKPKGEAKGPTPASKAPGHPGGVSVNASDYVAARRIELRLGVERMLQFPSASPEEGRAQGFGRAPSVFESKVCALGAISGTLQNGGEQIAAAMRRASSKMAEELIGRIETGKVTRANITNLRRSRPKDEADMIDQISTRFIAIASVGRRHAHEELARQEQLAAQLEAGSISRFDVMFADKSGIPPGESANMIPAGGTVPVDSIIAQEMSDLAQGAGGAKRMVSALVTKLANESRISSSIAVDSMWARLIEEAIAEYNSSIRSGLDDAGALRRVEAVLQGLSPARNDSVGRQLATVAYSLGRDVAAKEASVAAEAQWVARIEVLDTKTCRPCRQLDGIYLKIGTPEYEQFLPPSQCDGGDLCRGFPVIISNELADALQADPEEEP